MDLVSLYVLVFFHLFSIKAVVSIKFFSSGLPGMLIYNYNRTTLLVAYMFLWENLYFSHMLSEQKIMNHHFLIISDFFHQDWPQSLFQINSHGLWHDS